MEVQLAIGGRTFRAAFDDGDAARALISRMPFDATMSELNGNEKYVYLDAPLPADARRQSSIRAGDIMLFGSECLVLFYRDFPTSYSYTPIGRVVDATGLADAVGPGPVDVAWERA